MTYRLDPSTDLHSTVLEVAESQMGKLFDDLDDPPREEVLESVHDARKRCKKIRALSRLVRPAIGDAYHRTNEAFRDAARELSAIRDAQVLVETLDNLVSSAPTVLAPVRVDAARSEAVARREQAGDRALGVGGPMERARALARLGRQHVAAWQVEDDEAVFEGLRKTYRRAVEARSRCTEEPTTGSFHEWRKRVKYHRHHLELLRDTEPALVEPWAGRLHDLSDALGDDHDLSELVGTVTDDPDAFGGPEQVDAIEVLAAGRSSDLRSRALALGARLTAEEPSAVSARLETWWSAARDHGPSPQGTGLSDLPDNSV
jgi:CHAD domain-containing protein